MRTRLTSSLALGNSSCQGREWVKNNLFFHFLRRRSEQFNDTLKSHNYVPHASEPTGKADSLLSKKTSTLRRQSCSFAFIAVYAPRVWLPTFLISSAWKCWSRVINLTSSTDIVFIKSSHDSADGTGRKKRGRCPLWRDNSNRSLCTPFALPSFPFPYLSLTCLFTAWTQRRGKREERQVNRGKDHKGATQIGSFPLPSLYLYFLSLTCLCTTWKQRSGREERQVDRGEDHEGATQTDPFASLSLILDIPPLPFSFTRLSYEEGMEESRYEMNMKRRLNRLFSTPSSWFSFLLLIFILRRKG